MLVEGQDSFGVSLLQDIDGTGDISLMLVEGQDSLDYHYYRTLTGQVTFPNVSRSG